MKKGFTLPEIIVAISFFGILLGLVTISLFNAREQTVRGATIDVMLADIKEQQTKAMATYKEATASDYGVFIEADKYTLFNGTDFVPGASTNFEIKLDSSISISNILFSGSKVVFQKGSGEVSGFVNGQNSFVVNSSPNNNSKTININRFGVIDVE